MNATTHPALDQPSALQVAEALRGAHIAIRCYGWARTEPAVGHGPVRAETAIGMGITGWCYDPRHILRDADARVHDAAIAAVAAHLGLDDTDDNDPNRFAAWHDAADRTQVDVLYAFAETARALEGFTPDRVFVPGARDMTGVHHGVPLLCYGEDSSYLALGHIAPPLMVEASTACHLDLTGEPLAGGTWKRDALERQVQHTWAVHWRDERGHPWFDFDPDQRTPGSVPATTLIVD